MQIKKVIKKRIFTTVDPEILFKIDELAVNERRTRPDMIRLMVTDQVEKLTKPKKGEK